jgi:hypothetical protein
MILVTISRSLDNLPMFTLLNISSHQQSADVRTHSLPVSGIIYVYVD